MKKQKVANLIMVILILVIAAAGVLTAWFIRGWFDHDAQAATLREIRGVVTMQRGVSRIRWIRIRCSVRGIPLSHLPAVPLPFRLGRA